MGRYLVHGFKCCYVEIIYLDYYIFNWDVSGSVQIIKTNLTLWHTIETTENAHMNINSDVYM
jgi:hypothetical protein